MGPYFYCIIIGITGGASANGETQQQQQQIINENVIVEPW